ncbi:MAG: hypothetical protein ALAOOOJD_00267 [bacterium]|nr:hypothetical protein [bacterium]
MNRIFNEHRLILLLGCILIAGLSLFSPAIAQTTKWVDQAAGNDANDGNTPGTAYATLQFAINNSTSGTAGTPSVINVKDGIYETTGQTNAGGYSTAILVKDLDYLTIQAVPGHNPVVKPSAGGVVSISIDNCNHIIIDNIDSDQSIALFDNWHVRNSTDLTVRNCTFDGGDDGIDFETSHTTALIENNTFKNITTGSGDEALDFTDGAYSDVMIQDNTFLNNYRQITLFNEAGPISNFTIRRNFMNGTTSQEAVRFIGASNILVENNVIMNSLQQAIYIDTGCSNITIRHNTFFHNDLEEIRTKINSADIVIKNNIIYANGSYAALAASVSPLPGEDYNLIYNSGTLTESGSQPAVTAFGSNTIIGMDPLFVSTTAGSENLHLQDGSPALAAGVNLGVSEDIEKNPRPQPAASNPDMGAYEKGMPPGPCDLYVLLAGNAITIQRTKQTPPAGDIYSNGKVTFERGDPSEYDVNVTAVGKIAIDKENTISGDVTAGGVASIASGSTVTGTVTSNASVTPIPITAPSFSAGGQSFNIPKSGKLTLSPGSYNKVTMAKFSKLNLSSGEYFFNQLIVANDVVINMNVSGGKIVINVVSKATFDKDTEFRVTPGGESASDQIALNSLQAADLAFGAQSYVLGCITAPNAKVVLGNNTQFRGSIIAKYITIERDCLFYHHDSPGSLPGPGNLPKTAGDEEVASEQSPVTSYELAQNYPNPFNPTTTINFALPEAGEVTLAIYNIYGQLVRQLVAGQMTAGRHSVMWNGKNERGQQVASGMYLYVLKAGEFTAHRKLVLMK